MANYQRTPIARTLPLAAQRAALDEIEQRGYALPCHVTAVAGAIVTVAFDATASGAPIPPCRMPIAGAEYVRIPVQVGMKGVAYPASVDISIETGLGPGGALPDVSTLPANLSALVFVPVGNSGWAASPNANALVLYGATGGVLLQDKLASPSGSISVTSTAITLTFGSHTLVINSSGISLDGVLFTKHQHAASTAGGGTLVAPSGGGPVTGNTGEVSGAGP